MTGYQSKKKAALDEEGMHLVHQTLRDLATYGMSVTQGGKRIDPMSIYAQPAQWDTPSEAFNAWWDSDYDDSTNPYEKDTFAYWAWAGWQASLAQPAQEPVAWTLLLVGEHHGIIGKAKENFLGHPKHYERIDVYTAPPQRPWVGLTGEQFTEAARLAEDGNYLVAFQRIQQWLKEKNT